MGPDGILPSLLVYGSLPTFPAVHMDAPAQEERLKTLASARREMTSIIARMQIQQALRSRLQPATHFEISAGDSVYVYWEASTTASKKGDWKGPWKIKKIQRKEVYVDYEGTVKHFNISQVMPCPSVTGDQEL